MRINRNATCWTLRCCAAALAVVCCAGVAWADASSQPASAPATQASQPAPLVEPDEALRKTFPYKAGQDTAALDAVARDVRTAGTARRGELTQQFAAALKSSEPTTDCKKFLCKQLAALNSPEAVAVLAVAMERSATFHPARLALQDMPGPEPGVALRKALETNDASRLTGLMDSLAVRRDEAAAERIGKLIEIGSAGVAASAISTLSRIGGPQADAALARAESRAPGSLHPAIAQGRLRCAKQMAAEGQIDAAMTTCEQILAGSGPLVIRKSALQGLVQTQPARAAKTLAKLLVSSQRELASLADSYARALPGADVTAALGADIEKLPNDSQRKLIAVLEARNDVAARPALVKALKAGQRGTRLAALSALAKLGDAGLVPVLADTATGSDGELASAARRTLCSMPGRTVDQAILWAMKDAKPRTRIELIRALAQRKAAWTVPDLLSALDDTDASVRAEVFSALGQLAEPRLLNRLVEGMLSAKDAAVQTASEDAVVQCAQRIGNVDARAATLLDAMNRTRDTVSRARLLRVAGRLGGKRVLAAARRMRRDKDPKLRLVAIHVLADWPDESVLADLLEIVKKDKDPECQGIALTGYLRIAKARAQTDANAASGMYRDALQMARRTREKRLAIAAIAETPSIDALNLVAAGLSDKELSEPAAAAAVTIAAAIARRHRHETRTVMLKVIEHVKDATLSGKAAAVLTQLDAGKDHILVWQICGPYSNVDKTFAQMFDVPFGPEIGSAGVTWKPLLAGADDSRPWAVDIVKSVGEKEDCVVYLRTRVYSPREQPARLETGSDDGLKAWFNDAEVIKAPGTRRISSGQDTAEVKLRQGWNKLLLKVTQAGGDFSACARLRAPDGAKLEGLLESAD